MGVFQIGSNKESDSSALVSIIVPVFQSEKTLARCIESIITQTFQNIEVILVDDGSSDRSGDICDYYAETDKRVKVIHQLNGGVSKARNSGISRVNGKYIMFCDSDDWVAETWCERMVHYAELEMDRLIQCDVQRIAKGESFEPAAMSGGVERNESYYKLWKSGGSAYTVNKIYKTSIINEKNIRFDETVSFAEDVIFNVQYYRYCTGSLIVKEKLYYYQDNDNSLMHREYEDFFPVYSRPFTERLPLISDEELPEYCDMHLSGFIEMFSYVYYRNDSFWKKVAFNQKILEHDAFQFCLQHAEGKMENRKVICALKTKQYFVYYCLDQINKIKNRYRRKQK